MTPQEIIQALGIEVDAPPWDGEVREVQVTLYECRVRVLEISDGCVTAQMINPIRDRVTIHARIDYLRDIVLVY